MNFHIKTSINNMDKKEIEKIPTDADNTKLAGATPSYSNPAGAEYPVIAYNNVKLPTVNDSLTEAAERKLRGLLNSVKACGFNANIWDCGNPGQESLLRKNFEMSALLGLRTILHISGYLPSVVKIESDAVTYSPAIQELETLLNRYKGIENLWGYSLMYEPHYLSWAFEPPAPPVGLPNITLAYRTFLNNANGHMAFFNLAVDVRNREFVGDELVSNTSLTEPQKFLSYLDEIREKLNPPMMSVDMYPTFITNEPPYFTILYRYYFSLETIGRFSTQYNIPFWMFMLSNQHSGYNNKATPKVRDMEYPFPSESVLRFQAMTALAFGFQGIVFWTYGLPDSSFQKECDCWTDCYDADYWKTKGKKEYNFTCKCECNVIPKPNVYYYNAPYVNGCSTEIWNNCKAVIPDIKFYGKELLNARFQGSRHVYGPLLREPFKHTVAFSSPFGCIIRASASGRGFVITLLKKGSKNYMAIVSHDPYNEQDVTLTFAAGSKWTEINPENATEEAYINSQSAHGLESAVSRSIPRKLKPGGMILISY